MKNQIIKSNLFLLLAAAIWGLAFVAQRIGAQYVGSFTFNGIRFALGSLSLIPLILFSRCNSKSKIDNKPARVLPAGVIAGTILFMGATLQQLGLVETSAGKAAFITGLYIVIVPLSGIFLKHRLSVTSWCGVAIATIGLYFLSVTENFSIVRGDLLELAGAFFWAGHILVIDYFTKRIEPLKLCLIQFLTCSFLSMAAALFYESITLSGIKQAIIPILYGGVFSVGIAYTLQAVGQKHAKPAHAAIILSLESVFASLGGWLILQENLGFRGYMGCLLMLTGMLLSQLQSLQKTPDFSENKLCAKIN